MINKKKLLKKGWTKAEIAHVENVLDEAPTKKSEKIKTLDKIIYWGALFLVLVGNFVLTVIAIPFMLFASPLYLYPGMLFLGFVFGALFDLIIIDIEKIEEAPVIKPAIFLFAVAFINIVIMTFLSNQLAKLLLFERGIHLILLVSVVYILGFMFPYFYSRKTGFWEKVG